MTFYGIPPAPMRRAMAPDSGPDHARRIVGDALAWWLENRGGTSDLPIAVGTLATLALAAPSTPAGPDYGPLIIPLNDEELTDSLRAVWNSLWAYDPVLTDAARPLHEWLAQPSGTDTRGLADYARILVRAGLLEYASDLTRCEQEDVLGLLVQRMRSYAGRQAAGQFFTPANVANHHTEVLLTEPVAPGSRLLEPCAGTGTMVRAAAATLRFQGADPASYRWWMNDIDPLLVACCAVNAVLWRLGPDVTVSCGDTFRDPKELEAPARQRAENAVAEHKRKPVLYPTRTRPSPRWPV
ncbi:SAM-dependent methyltransferase [Streptomyces chartreusis]|uniref:N-6 DNA methylase n=1 Tax=Streptomyces chartreusis TaxID=1969 RepID=UPI003863A482|nr:SAM-dependent methyltransferase [Streptomyces chartreusis]